MQLAAVGRCRISSVRRNKRHGYRLAIVAPYVDEGGDEGGAPPPSVSLEAVHAEVASQLTLTLTLTLTATLTLTLP